MITVKITNMMAIRSAFRKSPVRMAKNLDKAIRKSIFLIEREGKMRTPVDTGRLRASYQTLFRPLRGETGPTVVYAPFVHEGTRYMTARPFLREAVKQNETEVQDYFKQAVQDTLDEIGSEV